jgi:hypothetical protein
MIYRGIIKKSRTLDLAMASQVLDAAALGFLAYSPEQLGITVPVYAAVRIGVNALQAYLRFKTQGPVGEK